MNLFNDFILSSMTSVFNIQLNNFTFYSSLPSLPNTNKELTLFLDAIPLGEPFFELYKTINYFSEVYKKILEAQKSSCIAVDIGTKNYKNRDNWLDFDRIPKYKLTLENVLSEMDSSKEVRVSVNSKGLPINFPFLTRAKSLKYFYKKIESSSIVSTIIFNKSAKLKTTFGDWFYTGAFLYAYQTPDNWGTSIISWEDVFNIETGILKYLNSNIVVVSDMTIQIHIEGEFNSEIVTELNQTLFFSDKHDENLVIKCVLEEDKSISISIFLSKNKNYLLGVEYSSVKSLLN